MPPIRNSAVAVGITTGAGDFTVYTVPLNTVLLLKDVRFLVPVASSQSTILYISDPASGATPYLLYEVIAAYTPTSWSGWLAMNAGQQIHVATPGETLHYWISGALLPQIPGF